MTLIRRALLSVSDKTGLAPFAKGLAERGVTLLSTGGTARLLRAEGLDVLAVSDETGFPEMMDGRVKTLHPKIHGAILGRRNNEGDQAAFATHGITPIDLVVVNLYPFEATIAKAGVTLPDAIEQIDIGGPSMVRSAAKNQAHVTIVTNPRDYAVVLEAMDQNRNVVTDSLRARLAKDAFMHTARYDAAIATYLATALSDTEEDPTQVPAVWGRPMEQMSVLRYGENPHQHAALFTEPGEKKGLVRAVQLQGKELSYNNWLDMDGAYGLARELSVTGCVVVKHTNPCGAAESDISLLDAYDKARACDPVSAFGGIVATRGVVTREFAERLVETFLEVVLASDVTREAREILARKKRLRVLVLDLEGWQGDLTHTTWLPRPISGGVLLQEENSLQQTPSDWRVVTSRQPSADEWRAMEFAWKVCKHVKSNAIVFAHADRSAAIGAGQMSRVDSTKVAVMKATQSLTGSIVASDAFFPFPDGVESASEAGATAVIQPGGSIRDEEVIEAANARDVAMVFTGTRHFRH